MQDDLFITNNQFQQEIRSSQPCFLIGNGICRYMGAPDWTAVLAKTIVSSVKDKALVKRTNGLHKLLQDKTIRGEVLTHPEVYTALLLECGIQKSRDGLKKHIKNLFIQPCSCRLLEYALRTKSQILTTNFDFAIERALWPGKGKNKTDYPISQAKDTPHSDTYPFCEYAASSKRKDLFLDASTASKGYAEPYITDECAVWHVHGFISRSKSILLGFEDYIAAIIYLKRLQTHSPQGAKHYAEPWEDGFVLKNSWLRLFFKYPLVIVGNGLNSEELFLRWLLVRRQRQKILQPNAIVPPVYYLDTKEEAQKKPDLDMAKLVYLKALGMKVVRYANYAELYDGQQWEVDSSIE